MQTIHTMVFVIRSAPSCQVATQRLRVNFKLFWTFELVSRRLIQNVLWEVPFHVELKLSTFRLKVFYNEVVLDSAVERQIKVKKRNSSGRKSVRHFIIWQR